MRRRIKERISRAWWSVLAAVGFPRERWLALPFLDAPHDQGGALDRSRAHPDVAGRRVEGVGACSGARLAAARRSLVSAADDRRLARREVGRAGSPCSRSRSAIRTTARTCRSCRSSGRSPAVSTVVVMMIFTVMALGLNFVVGYAGLLDLGYVAFYAMGAYMAGWFASDQFAKQNVDFGAVGSYKGDTGFHFSIWLVLLDGRHRDGDRRRADRAADAAAPRRLPRHRHARLRRDPAADRAQRRQSLRHGLQPHERHRRDHADRRPGLRQLGARASRLTGAVSEPAGTSMRSFSGPRSCSS